MKHSKALFFASVFLVIYTIVVVGIVANRQPKPYQPPTDTKPETVVEQNPMVPSVPAGETKTFQIRQEALERVSEAAPAGNTVPPHSELSVRTAEPQARRPQAATPPPPKSAKSKPKPELQDPMAREILKLVGSDPNADAYWIRAIFDSNLSNEERDDLIEDLNEEGLSDQKHPGPQDRKLILSRLIMIEEVYPYADSVMLPHLQEAYKDLKNLLAITEGGGEPVK